MYSTCIYYSMITADHITGSVPSRTGMYTNTDTCKDKLFSHCRTHYMQLSVTNNRQSLLYLNLDSH